MTSSTHRMTAALLLSPLLLLNVFCETMNVAGDKIKENKETVIGGVLGGAVGAGVGKLVGGNTGMMIGAGAGIVTGALAGNYIARQERTRTQTTASVGYRPEQGNVLTISEATAAPTIARQGEPVKVSLKYTILRPDEEKAMVKETHEIRCNGSVLGSKTADRMMDQGEQRITWEYPIKSDAQAGTYQIITTAQIEEKQTASIVTFTVK